MKKRLKPKKLTAMQAIRKHCIECSGYSLQEVGRCTLIDCALWPLRFGCYPEKAERNGHQVNPYEASGQEYQWHDMDRPYTYKEVEAPLDWELPVRDMVKKRAPQ